MERIKKAQNLYKRRYGVLPADDGYIFSGIVREGVCFATDEKALGAYIKASHFINRKVETFGWEVTFFVIAFWAIIICLFCATMRTTLIVGGTCITPVLVCLLYDAVCKGIYNKQKEKRSEERRGG